MFAALPGQLYNFAMQKKSTRFLWAILVLWLAFGLRLYRIEAQSIWWDEGHSIFVATHPIAHIPTLPAMDVHPPAYFALLHLWMAIAGHSEFALRYLSVIFSLLTIAVLGRFAACLSPRSAAAWMASLLAAMSPLYIAYAQEVRSYAMITVLALAGTFLLWRFLFLRLSQDTLKKRRIVLLLYIIVTAACLYTHYFTIFLLLFQNLMWLVWLVKNRRGHLLQSSGLWLGSQLAVVVLFMPQLTLALRQVTSYTNPNLIPPTVTHFISRSWQAYTTGLTLDAATAQGAMWVIIGVLVITWSIIFMTKPVVNFSGLVFNFILLALWFLLPLAAYYIILQRQPSFEPRYLMLVTPPIFLLLALGLNYLPRIAHHAPRTILFLILTGSLLTGTYNYYTNENYFKDDSAGVANWLAAETTPNDVVYVDVPHPFHYYADRIPAPTRYLFVDIHTAANTLNQEAGAAHRLFWVTWWGSDTDPRGVVPFLAEKAGQKVGEIDFKGYKIQWFDLPNEGQISFNLPDKLTPSNATFGDVLRLDGIAMGENILAGEPLWATLHFSLLRDTDVDYKVSLRARGVGGQIVTQLDRDLLNDRHFRTSAWPIDDPALNQAINVYLIPLTAGTYQLEAVVYSAQPPYPSEGVTGHESNDGVAAILGNITVTP